MYTDGGGLGLQSFVQFERFEFEFEVLEVIEDFVWVGVFGSGKGFLGN